MRYSADHKAQTHDRIVKEAAARFRRDGIGATGLQPLMKALGLTHGGFYAHFKSKDELVETALQAATDELTQVCEKAFAKQKPLHSFIDTYLSPTHRDSPEKGCPLPTMAAELGQRGQPSATIDRGVEDRLGRIAATLNAQDADEQAVVMLSTLVGALMLSRSVEDPQLSLRILDTARKALKLQADGASQALP
ncbi:TetR/AcrR family transcriptional regulator [Pseudomonas sp.]|uniref:TetR/AcrR family transcriptional regulator n=1 Tax=Pseudomonas sp. TaxID=306 RepID=UPI003CC69546